MTGIQFTLNGQPVRCEVAGTRSLLRVLRDDLKLTGTKEGCDGPGHCGTCLVLLDDQPKLACMVKMDDVTGRRVLAIEGLADTASGTLHPLQQAFIHTAAVQCGFCIPGMILAAKALLDRNPQPSVDEIKQALARVLCRCTGYSKIIEAVQVAALAMAAPPSPQAAQAPAGAAIGRSVPKADAVGKVTGRAQYSADLFMDGMLHGKVLWSSQTHAEIAGIDTAAAAAMPGVRAVLTAKDVPGLNRFGAITPDQPVLAEGRVRCVGEVVALVFAETPELAEVALEKIHVEYRPLPGVFSIEEALRPDAPQVHDTGNTLTHIEVETGDVQTALAAADVVVDDVYCTPFVDQGFLEPEAGMAVADDDGGLTIWSGVQNPFDIRRQIADAVGLPAEKVRFCNLAVGGAFGGKCDVSLQIHLALGALATRRPVKMVFSRRESLLAHPKRHAFQMRYRMGATRAGQLVGLEADLVGDTGAYASWGHVTLRSMSCFGCGAYVWPNTHVKLTAVYTNNPPAGAWRGFGVPQAHVALESQMDRLARALGMDPFDFRLLNALEPGAPTYMGQVLHHSVGFKRTLTAAREALAELAPQVAGPGGAVKNGVGVACGFKSVGFPTSMRDGAGANIEIDAAGRVLLRVGAVDIGQGSDTSLAQIVAEALDMSPDRVETQPFDTGLSPEGGPTVASRTTYVSGNAALGAAQALRARMISRVAEIYGRDESVLRFEGERFVDLQAEEELTSLEALAARPGETLRAEYRFVEAATDKPAFPVRMSQTSKSAEDFYYISYAFATQVAVVEVDERSGRVTVRHIIAAHDVGKAIHPRNIEGQIEGSCLMGMGTALTEEYQVENGWTRTDSLAKCGLTKITRAPDIIPLIIEDEEPAGPCGAKGIAEVAAIPTAAAVLNAIYDAVGVRLTQMPATPTRVREALRQRDRVAVC